MLFITTNAGATGLNLQAANTVINVDLPWNPAILEQRIARAHRMGQKRPVQIFLLVTTETLEENLLATLSAKHELSLAVLDPEAEAAEVDLNTGIEELKRRLEVLLGARPEAAEDERMKAEAEREAAALARKEKMATAGGQLIGATFAFIGEMMPEAAEVDAEALKSLTSAFRAKLGECMKTDTDGRMKMTVTFPNDTVMDQMANALARIAGAVGKPV